MKIDQLKMASHPRYFYNPLTLHQTCRATYTVDSIQLRPNARTNSSDHQNTDQNQARSRKVAIVAGLKVSALTTPTSLPEIPITAAEAVLTAVVYLTTAAGHSELSMTPGNVPH